MDALVQLIRPISTTLNLSTLPLHIHHVLSAFLLYEFLFRLASPLLSTHVLFPRAYARLDRRGRTKWNVHVVSTVQSLLICAMALHVMLRDPERRRAATDWRERLWGYSPLTGRVQGFAAGYFLWDLLASLEHLDALGVSSLVHAVAALGVTGLGFRPFANYYGINFVLYELSTPFLNLHWFMDKLNLTGSRAQLFNGILLLISFAGCRLVWGVYQSALIYNDVWQAWHATTPFANRCSAFFRVSRLGALIDVPLGCRVLPTWLGVLYVGANTVLTLLNFYWYSKMIAAVRKRFKPLKQGGKAEDKKQK